MASEVQKMKIDSVPAPSAKNRSAPVIGFQIDLVPTPGVAIGTWPIPERSRMAIPLELLQEIKSHGRLVIMNTRLTALLLLVLLIGFSANLARAQDDIYFVNSQGKLLRWVSKLGKRDPIPQRLSSLSGISRIASFAVNRLNEAFVNNGMDGNIYRTDGVDVYRAYSHPGQVRQLAFGYFNHFLFFSVVPTPQNNSALSDGQIFKLDLGTGQVERTCTVAQNTVGHAWWGAFTMDIDNRVFLGTSDGAIYELWYDCTPILRYRSAHDNIMGLTSEVNNFYYATGGSQVYRLNNFRDRQVALDLPGESLTHVSYASFPLSDEHSEPCQLFINLQGTDPRLVSQFFPVLLGPNLRWLSGGSNGNGGLVGPGRWQYYLLPGVYWVSMDSKGDFGIGPKPTQQSVSCTGAKEEVWFRL